MKAICWDFDGTFVHSHCRWSGSIWNAIKEAIPETTITLDDVAQTEWLMIRLDT